MPYSRGADVFRSEYHFRKPLCVSATFCTLSESRCRVFTSHIVNKYQNLGVESLHLVSEYWNLVVEYQNLVVESLDLVSEYQTSRKLKLISILVELLMTTCPLPN